LQVEQLALQRCVIEQAITGSRGEDQQRIAEVAIDWTATLLGKNFDYGSCVWKEGVLTPGMDPIAAIRVRMSDKIARLRNLLENNPEVNESIEDTVKDLGAYCLLWLAAPKCELEADTL
jgi:hypothetical protein